MRGEAARVRSGVRARSDARVVRSFSFSCAYHHVLIIVSPARNRRRRLAHRINRYKKTHFFARGVKRDAHLRHLCTQLVRFPASLPRCSCRIKHGGKRTSGTPPSGGPILCGEANPNPVNRYKNALLSCVAHGTPHSRACQ